jgi:NTE family protein
MVKRLPAASASSYRDRTDHTLLVLQGGGSLGAYQAGVYEALWESGFAPDWVTGVSIGAINAALIAGNPPERRVERLREFWDRVSSANPLIAPAALDPFRRAFNLASASASATFGVPGFFEPRIPPAIFAPPGTVAALSVYDTAPLRETLKELVDFDLINERDMRFSVGAVQVMSGNSVYFDNFVPDTTIAVEHVMASGALPPGFPPVKIGKDYYWDGGLVSNSPLSYVLDDTTLREALILQVDLFSARGAMPTNLDEVLERQKDIQYSSKTRFNTNRAKELEALGQALNRVLERLPASFKNDTDVKLLAEAARGRKVAVVQLINRRYTHSSQSKDYDFSRATVRTLWESGRDAVRRTTASPQWPHACSMRHGLQTFDLAA